MANRRTWPLAGLLGLLCLGVAPRAPAEDARADIDRIVRDQRTVKDRLDKIMTKMERLAEKLRREDKTYSAQLLDQALEELRSERLTDRIDEIVPDLAAARFTSLDRQKELLDRLERVYTILLDRNDLDKLEEQLQLVKEGLEKISQLRGEQNQLIRETTEVAENAEALAARAQAALEELLEQQRELSEATRQSAAEGDEQLAAMKQALDQLAERQADELARTRESIERATGIDTERLEQALAAARSARERLDAQSAEPQEGSASDAVRDDLRRAREALEAVSRAEDADAESAPRPEFERDAARAADDAEKAADEGDEEALRAGLDRLAEALAAGREALSAALQAEGAAAPPEADEPQRSIAADARELAKSLEERAAAASETTQENLAEAQQETGAAAAAAEQAAERLAAADAVAAAGAQREALEALNAARKALDEAAAGARERMQGLAARQEYLASRVQQAQQDLEKLRKLQPEPEKDELLRLAREAEEQMAQASSSLESGKPSAAGPSQQQAESAMQELAKKLDGARASLQKPETAADKQRYADLAGRQAELERKTRELAERLKDLEDKRSQESLANAASRMDQAGSQLEQQEGQQALPREQEAEKYLQQASQELEQEEERYQELRQEELLFRVREELVILRDEQKDILEQTIEVDLEREEKDRLSRSARARVRDLAGRERTLRQRNDEMNGKVREDGATVFQFTLTQNSEDLAQVAELLGSQPHATDATVQDMQRDVLERYETLMAVLDDELDRRRKAEPSNGDQQQNQPQGERPLIPMVAELLMVKNMEEEALRRIEGFLASNPELGEEGLDDMTRDRLLRMGHQHAKITELFRKLVDDGQGVDVVPPADGSDEGDER